MLNVKRWIIEAVILSLVFAGVGYAAHETKFSGLRITDLTASRAVVTDADKDLASSTTTATELGYVNGVTSAIQTQLDARCLESVFGTALSTGLTLDGTDLKVSTTLQSLTGLTETNGGIPYGTADNAYAWLAAGTAGYLFQGNGAGAPSWVNSISIGAGTFAGVLTVSPDATNEVFQVNDGSVDFTDGNAGTTGTLTVDASGNLSYNKSFTSTGLTLAGTLTLNEQAILVDAALASDHTWTGPTQLVTAGEELTIGELAYLKSDGKYWLIDANAVDTSKGKIVMATATISADGTGIVLLPSAMSFFRDDSTTEWTVTNIGEEQFLSTTEGESTNDVSGYTTSDIVRIVGYMETATIMNFNVDKTYIEVD